MKKLFALTIMILISGSVFSEEFVHKDSENASDPVRDKKRYEAAFEKWTDTGPVRYSMRLKYAAFSPLSGIWEVEVSNGNVIRWKFKNTVNNKRYQNFAANLTMEHLFEIAKQSLENNNERPFLILANYDIDRGHVRNVSRLKNQNYTGNTPTDKNFRYDVHAITIHSAKRSGSK